MKLLLTFAIMLTSASSLFDYKPLSIDGKATDLNQYKGKKILIVNTASQCGYTPQYEGLEKLYKKYQGKLVIIGFPANNFGGQEPGTNSDIKSFCSKNYGVTFPMMSKVSVTGDDIDPLFKWLTSQENPDFTGDIKWNFEKFLLDENGKLIRRFRSKTTPEDASLSQAIEAK
ncbi:MAG: glutathione peroxidase [Bacteroidetes bacterium]|nr:glutathione peroxidase [Bacteroidota bacterium]